MPTNAEYLERWEDAAPTAVISDKPAEAKRTNGDDGLQSYMDDREDPALLEAIAEYAERISDAKPTQETLDTYAERKEYNDNVAREYQWVTPAEYADGGARIGRIMHSSAFIIYLQKAGVKCWYRRHPQPGKMTLVVQPKLATLPPEVGCWVQGGFMPELSIMRFDDHGVPTTEKNRGWRTCLLQLILKSHISQKVADEVFGKPPTTEAFHRYNNTLRVFRDQGGRLAS